MGELKVIPGFNEAYLSSLDINSVRDFIAKAEAIIAEQEQVEIPVEHRFSEGVYAREVEIPQGSFIIGKIHKFSNLNFLLKGELLVLSIEGCSRVKAPATIVSQPGVKRFAYALEDSTWTTVHGTHETDIEKIEATFIAKDYSELLQHSEIKLINTEI